MRRASSSWLETLYNDDRTCLRLYIPGFVTISNYFNAFGRRRVIYFLGKEAKFNNDISSLRDDDTDVIS